MPTSAYAQRRMPAFFPAFTIVRAKQKERKSKSAEHERKNANSRFFILFTEPSLETQFQSPKPLGRDKEGS
jgi:hypothetical protein